MANKTKGKAASRGAASIKVTDDVGIRLVNPPGPTSQEGEGVKWFATKPDRKPIKECPECKAWHHPRTSACPRCGHAYPEQKRGGGRPKGSMNKAKAEQETPRTTPAPKTVVTADLRSLTLALLKAAGMNDAAAQAILAQYK